MAKKEKARKGKKRASPSMPKPIKERMNKSQLHEHFLEQMEERGFEVDKKMVKEFFQVLEDTIIAHVRKKGAGEFMLPGLLKVKTKHVPAKKKRKGTNPFTGEPTVFKAKPATTKVKANPMKKLKDAAIS